MKVTIPTDFDLESSSIPILDDGYPLWEVNRTRASQVVMVNRSLEPALSTWNINPTTGKLSIAQKLVDTVTYWPEQCIVIESGKYIIMGGRNPSAPGGTLAQMFSLEGTTYIEVEGGLSRDNFSSMGGLSYANGILVAGGNFRPISVQPAGFKNFAWFRLSEGKFNELARPASMPARDISSLALSPNGKILAVGFSTGYHQGLFCLFEINNFKLDLVFQKTVDHPRTKSVFNPNGTSVIFAWKTNFIEVNIETYAVSREDDPGADVPLPIWGENVIFDIKISPDGRFLAIIVDADRDMGDTNDTLAIFERDSSGEWGIISGITQPHSDPSSCVFSDSSAYFYTFNYNFESHPSAYQIGEADPTTFTRLVEAIDFKDTANFYTSALSLVPTIYGYLKNDHVQRSDVLYVSEVDNNYVDPSNNDFYSIDHWTEVSVSNRHRMFDAFLNSVSTYPEITVVVVPTVTGVDSVCFFGLDAALITVRVLSSANAVVSESVNNVSGKTKLVVYLTSAMTAGQKVQAVISGSGNVSCTKMVVGEAFLCGSTKWGVEFKPINYGREQTDEFGRDFLKQGAKARRIKASGIVESSNMDATANMLENTAFIPCVFDFNGDDTDNDSLVAYGIHETPSLIFHSYNHNKINMDVRGLI